MLWDEYAIIIPIILQKAREIGFHADPTKIFVIKLDAKWKLCLHYVYSVPLLDIEGEISTELYKKSLRDITFFFQFFTSSNKIHNAEETGTLNGFKYAVYQPVRKKSPDHFLVLGNSFGCCVGVSHPLL